jgi:hypothetical protein
LPAPSTIVSMTWRFTDVSDPGNGIYGQGASTTSLYCATNGEAVFRLKEALKSWGWVIQASSDGTNFSNTAGNLNDQITTAAEMNNANAWWVIKEPSTQGRQYGLKRFSTTSWLVTYIPRDGSNNTQAASVAGTATALPTYTTQVALHGTLPNTGATSWFNTEGTAYFHIGVDDAAPYNFYMISATVGTGACEGGTWIRDGMLAGSYPSADVDPYVNFLGKVTGVTGSSNALSVRNFSYSTGAVVYSNSVAGHCYLRKNLSGETYVSIQAAWPSTKTVSSVVGAVNVNNFGTDSHAGRIYTMPLVWIRGTYNSQAVPVGYKGISSFIRWTMLSRSGGTTLTISSTRDRVIFGDINVPWDGSVPRI